MSENEKVVDFDENKNKKGGKVKKFFGNLKDEMIYIKNCVCGNGDDNYDNYMGGRIRGLLESVGLYVVTIVSIELIQRKAKENAFGNAMKSAYFLGQRDEAEKLIKSTSDDDNQ